MDTITKAKISRFFKTSRANKLAAVLVLVVVAAAGYALIRSSASGFFASVEPENGSITKAQVITDATASSGKALQFAGNTTTPPPTQGTNCIAKPSACGFPDETNTGYKPTGVTLTTNGVNFDSDGDYVIDQAGAVIDSKKINGCVVVKAANVTIKRSLITNCKSYFNIRLYPGSPNFLLEDTEVDGNNFADQNAALVDDGVGPVTVRRMYMHNVPDGPHPGEHWLITDSYITDLYACDICHNDAIQSAGALDVTVRHNTIINTPPDNPSGEGGRNADVRIATEQGIVDGFVVENNLLSGGNYAVQVREQGNGTPRNVRILNNRIVPNWRFGPFDITPGPATLSGNVRDDNNAALREKHYSAGKGALS